MRKYLVAATVAVLAVTAAACSSTTGSSGSSGSSSTGAPTTLSIAQVQAPSSFAPGDLKSGPTAQYFQPVYDTLIRLDANTEPGANVATAWKYDTALTTLSLTLRSDVTFTDGSKLDAAAVKATLEKAEKGKDESATQLKFIKSVDVVDATHVDLKLSAPDPSLLPNLGGVAGMIASPKAIAGTTLATAPVGSGPYVLAAGQTQAGSKYLYTRNDKYWNKKAFPFDTITITVFNDSNAVLNGLRSKQLDAANITSKDAAGIKSAGLNILSYPSGSTAGLYIFDRQGKTVPALANVKVRQALNYAFDRPALLKQVYGGAGTASTQLFNVDSVAYDPSLNSTYTYNVAKAKQLLAEAGYAKGFKLTMPDVTPVFPQEQAALTEALTAIGVTPVYEPVNGQTFISDLLGGKYAASYFLLDNFRAWDTTQFSLAPDALWNTFHVSDSTAVGLISQAQAQTGDDQAVTFKKLNKYVVDQAWFAPWAQINDIYATSKKVTVTAQKFSAYPPIYNFRPAG